MSFDNPAYDSVSDSSRVQANSDRESVISPPRRCSVISPPAAAAVTRASVISSPPSNKVRGAFKKKTAYFMTSGKKVGGPRTKTKFQKKI